MSCLRTCSRKSYSFCYGSPSHERVFKNVARRDDADSTQLSVSASVDFSSRHTIDRRKTTSWIWRRLTKKSDENRIICNVCVSNEVPHPKSYSISIGNSTLSRNLHHEHKLSSADLYADASQTQLSTTGTLPRCDLLTTDERAKLIRLLVFYIVDSKLHLLPLRTRY